MTEAMVRVRALARYGETISELGGNPNKAMRACGLLESAVDNADGWVPFGAVLEAYEIASRLTDRRDFGMYLGSSRDLSYLGPLILIFKYSENLGLGLSAFARYLAIQNSGYVLSLDRNGESAALRFRMSAQHRARADQWIEESLVTALIALRLFLGASYVPAGVRIAHGPTSSAETYREYFGIDPDFNAGEDSLRIENAVLALRNPKTDKDMVGFLESYLQSRVPAQNNNIGSTVRTLLLDLIPTGNYSIDVVAEQLKIHRRTLQRRLADDGVRYADILDQCRAEMAVEYLAGSNLPIVNLAHMLGYSDQSAFNHAFRRWHGMSPTVFAEHQKSLLN